MELKLGMHKKNIYMSENKAHSISCQLYLYGHKADTLYLNHFSLV